MASEISKVLVILETLVSYQCGTKCIRVVSHQKVSSSVDLTDAVASLPTDGRCALNVGPGGGHVVVPAKLRQQVLNEVDEDQVPAGHDQVA